MPNMIKKLIIIKTMVSNAFLNNKEEKNAYI